MENYFLSVYHIKSKCSVIPGQALPDIFFQLFANEIHTYHMGWETVVTEFSFGDFRRILVCTDDTAYGFIAP